MTRATRLSVLLAALLVSGSAVAQSTDETTDAPDPAASETSDEAGGDAETAPRTADEGDSDEQATQPPLPPDAFRYQVLYRPEFDRLERTTGLNIDAVLNCEEEEEAGRRERTITRSVPLTVYVLDDLSLHVAFEGDDPDGEIAQCFGEAVGEMELEPAPEDLARSRYGWVFEDHTFFQKRRMRHGEIIALYTLSGVSAGVAIGSFLAARNDDSELERRLAEPFSTDAARRNLEQRPDRFRAAAWSMVGISIASFVGGSLLHSANREIERRENPILVLSPGSPTGDLGFTLSGNF